MKPLATAIAAVVLGSGVGCVHFQPIGPLADSLAGSPAPVRQTAGKGTTVTAAKDASAMPMLPDAPPPPAPTFLVTPGEVTEANHQNSARRLLDEMEADRKAMESMPKYPEMSIIRSR
jgi:hypothetical protein